MDPFFNNAAWLRCVELLKIEGCAVQLFMTGGHTFTIDSLAEEPSGQIAASSNGNDIFLSRHEVVGYGLVTIAGYDAFPARFEDAAWSDAFVALRAACDESDDPSVREAAAALEAVEAAAGVLP